MGCFSSSHSKSQDLGNHSFVQSSSYDQMAEGTPLNEQNLGAFGIDSIEYADHGQSLDDEDGTYCRKWSDNEERYQDTSWRGGGENSEGYDNTEDF